MSAWRRRMREPARTIGGRRLQRPRSGLLVQGFDYPPEAAERAAKAKTADDPGAIACRLPPGAGRSGREAVEPRLAWPWPCIWSTTAEWFILLQPAPVPPLNFNVYERRLENADMHLRIATMAVLLAGFQCFAGCNGSAGAADDQGPQETLWPTKSWQVSTPEEQGMDSASLARLIENVGAYKQDSLMIIRHGKIVAEAYYAPYVAGISHDLRSVTKSVVGTLTAIQLKNGSLDSVDHPVMDLLSDRQIQNVDDRKKAMTVQSLLDMTSGIEWVEKAYTPGETIIRMYESPDRTAFVLNQPMAGVPGANFNYNGGNTYLLSALINKKSGQSALDFARKELFEPLGIESAKWGPVDAQGVTNGEAGLFLSPHDMARIGYLYLRNGMWEGKQIIPSSWVDRTKAGSVTATLGFHYANLWWSYPEKGAYMAHGRHSQLILVLPKL